MLCGTASSKGSLFFGDDVLRLWLEPVQHDVVWVANEAEFSVVFGTVVNCLFSAV